MVRRGNDADVDRLPHGYTNFTRLVDGYVEKIYDGPRRFANASRERACLSALGDHLSVAKVVDHDLAVPRLALGFLPGRHGQDLIGTRRVGEISGLPGLAGPDLGDGRDAVKVTAERHAQVR